VFIPKYRRKTLYAELRRHLGEVFRKLAEQKESRIEEGHLLLDHVHMLISIPPKYAVSRSDSLVLSDSAWETLMRGGLFWLNDGQWACIAPHLPMNLTGPERDDDRRIIRSLAASSICSSAAPAGATVRPSMVPTRPSTIASIAGPNGDGGGRFSKPWPIAVSTA
jgi:Transposase IS200 like